MCKAILARECLGSEQRHRSTPLYGLRLPRPAAYAVLAEELLDLFVRNLINPAPFRGSENPRNGQKSASALSQAEYAASILAQSAWGPNRGIRSTPLYGLR